MAGHVTTSLMSCDLFLQLSVQCSQKTTAPREMFRGSATTDHQFAYFTPDSSNSIYGFELSTGKWEKLPCPYRNCALVIIDGALTAVGGGNSTHITNKLFTLQQKQWVEEYPPMNTAHSYPAVVSTPNSDYIMVIGGHSSTDSDWTATVELFQVKSRKWFQLTDLPKPLHLPSATMCGNQVHVIGDGANGYTCSLKTLLSSAEPITWQVIPHLISWTSLPRLPVTFSTAATLNGELIVIGGKGPGLVNSIHQLVDKQWMKIGSMSDARYWCLAVSLSSEKMMIVGGGGALDSVEECIIDQYE